MLDLTEIGSTLELDAIEDTLTVTVVLERGVNK